MVDLLIKNGTIYDGTGGDPYIAHLVIEGDRISDIVRNEHELPA